MSGSQCTRQRRASLWHKLKNTQMNETIHNARFRQSRQSEKVEATLKLVYSQHYNLTFNCVRKPGFRFTTVKNTRGVTNDMRWGNQFFLYISTGNNIKKRPEKINAIWYFGLLPWDHTRICTDFVCYNYTIRNLQKIVYMSGAYVTIPYSSHFLGPILFSDPI